MSEEKRTDPLEESRQRWTEIAYRFAEAMNEGRVSEGQERYSDERVGEIVQEFVRRQLASEAEARQSRQD